jgi:hypothetical protein
MNGNFRKRKMVDKMPLKNRIIQVLILGIGFFLFLSCTPAPLKDEASIEKFLMRNQYLFSIDPEGDYKLTIPLENQGENNVWIRKDVNFSGNEAVREIFSVGAVLDEIQTTYLSKYLLQDNLQTRVMGSWAYMRNDRNKTVVLIYLIKLPLATDSDYLKNALSEAAFAAEVMERVINQND